MNLQNVSVVNPIRRERSIKVEILRGNAVGRHLAQLSCGKYSLGCDFSDWLSQNKEIL